MKQKFKFLFITQFFGVLNDNLLKSLICFLAVLWNSEVDNEAVVSISATLLILPYLLLSPLAGRLATFHSKVRIVRWAKFAELPIMLIASIAFWFQLIELAYVSLFLMGAQSALYSPAKYGLIKELKGGEDISYGTGMMEMLSFIGILLGSTLAGYIAEFDGVINSVIFTTFMLLALLGWISSLKLPRPNTYIKGRKTTSINPLSFFINTSKEMIKIKGSLGVVFGISFFWMIASLMQFNLFLFCKENLNMDTSETGLVIAMLSIGIGIGCFMAGKLLGNRVEPGLSVFALLGMVVCFWFVGFYQLSVYGYLTFFMITAFFSGLYKVPLNAWFQQRVGDEFRGRALAYLNMVVFLFVLLTAGLFYFISHKFGTLAVFKFSFVACLLAFIIAFRQIPVFTLRFLFLLIAKVMFRTRVYGDKNIPLMGGALFVSNHVSFMDSFLLVAAAPRNMRFVMIDTVYYHWSLHWLFKRLNMIPISVKNTPETLVDFTKRCQDEINKGHILCVFPEGQLNRGVELNEFKKGIEFIIDGIDAPVIPIYLDGLHKTPLAWNRDSGKLNGFWLSRWFRKVSVTIGEPIEEKLRAVEYREKVIALATKRFSCKNSFR